ncbi:hypothetical protein ACISON_05700, partial [Campylobacter jejuni]
VNADNWILCIAILCYSLCLYVISLYYLSVFLNLLVCCIHIDCFVFYSSMLFVKEEGGIRVVERSGGLGDVYKRKLDVREKTLLKDYLAEEYENAKSKIK